MCSPLNAPSLSLVRLIEIVPCYSGRSVEPRHSDKERRLVPLAADYCGADEIWCETVELFTGFEGVEVYLVCDLLRIKLVRENLLNERRDIEGTLR